MGAYGGTAEASKSASGADTILLYDFALDSNPGWSTEGQWQFGWPQCVGGANGNPDPSYGSTGQNVYGVNLAGPLEAGRGRRLGGQR